MRIFLFFFPLKEKIHLERKLSMYLQPTEKGFQQALLQGWLQYPIYYPLNSRMFQEIFKLVRLWGYILSLVDCLPSIQSKNWKWVA